MRSDSSIAGKVRKRIEKGGPEKLWTYADFRSLPPLAVAAALSRLAKEGTIRRARKGVYYSPRKTRFGELAPDAASVAAAVLKGRDVEWRPSGLPAYNGLGFTTQVSPMLTIDVADSIRSLEVGAPTRVRVRRVPSLKGLSADERTLLDALGDLRRVPDASPAEVISRARDLFREKRFSIKHLARYSRSEPPRVRAILGAIGSEVGTDTRTLATLRKSLNPMTTFHIGLGETLPRAREWQIQ
jgi:hypothetical protein